MDGFLFVSGQIHKLPDGGLVGTTIEEKTKQTMGNIQEILSAAEYDFSHVLKVTVYVTDMSQYSAFNTVYATYFTQPFPAREVVCVQALPLGASLEISVIAKK